MFLCISLEEGNQRYGSTGSHNGHLVVEVVHRQVPEGTGGLLPNTWHAILQQLYKWHDGSGLNNCNLIVRIVHCKVSESQRSSALHHVATQTLHQGHDGSGAGDGDLDLRAVCRQDTQRRDSLLLSQQCVSTEQGHKRYHGATQSYLQVPVVASVRRQTFQQARRHDQRRRLLVLEQFHQRSNGSSSRHGHLVLDVVSGQVVEHGGRHDSDAGNLVAEEENQRSNSTSLGDRLLVLSVDLFVIPHQVPQRPSRRLAQRRRGVQQQLDEGHDGPRARDGHLVLRLLRGIDPQHEDGPLLLIGTARADLRELRCQRGVLVDHNGGGLVSITHHASASAVSLLVLPVRRNIGRWSFDGRCLNPSHKRRLRHASSPRGRPAGLQQTQQHRRHQQNDQNRHQHDASAATGAAGQASLEVAETAGLGGLLRALGTVAAWATSNVAACGPRAVTA
mmetsp:Transcript_80380/g.260532  ORF Transcript_80380/g.260532 Transcript_80380/m.260532 type:complete len:448 (+) Transcript_80380:142-1485(+)